MHKKSESQTVAHMVCCDHVRFVWQPANAQPPHKLQQGATYITSFSRRTRGKQVSAMGASRMQGYFRDPWFALNLLREMWLLFNPREMWFVYYRDPWFHKYFPRYPWKKPHCRREKWRKNPKNLGIIKRSSTKNRRWRNSYATMEYYRYKCRCTLHTEETLLVGPLNGVLHST